jgi:hypothetical protein
MTSLLPFATTLKYSELAENASLLPHFSVIPVISTILVYFADSERMNSRNSAGRSERPPGFPELPGLWALSTRRWRLPPTCPERVAEFPPAQAIRTRARCTKFAKELIALRPDILVVNSTAPLIAARQAAGAIPIIMAAIADPVAQGFVQSHYTGRAGSQARAVRRWRAPKRIRVFVQMRGPGQVCGARCAALDRGLTHRIAMCLSVRGSRECAPVLW